MTRPGENATVGMIRRESPPSRRRPASAYRQAVALIPDLRGDPDAWWLVAECAARSSAHTLARRLTVEHPEVEWRGHSPDGVTSRLYARHRTMKEIRDDR